ncbi:MAG: DUF2029 domain-containing protein [Burkholderiales bacterium]|nr:DUF2029 domain-containing protein [Phycisphaerae bacterium]
MIDRLRGILHHSWRGLLAITIVIVATYAGLWVRDQAWDRTLHLRFDNDINNGFRWGMRANQEGYFSIYEREGDPDEMLRVRLDYAPLRLGLMTWWTHGLLQQFEDVQLQMRYPSRAFHKRLLDFNTACGFLTAVAAGILTFHLVRWRIDQPHAWSGTATALIAACVTWFNPVILYNAHVWPQWDIWPMPFFLFAVYLSLKRWWLPAGILLGIGALLKGQLLMAAWVLPLWALFMGDWRGMLKILVGLAFGLALVGMPWEISTYNPAAPVQAFDLWDRTYDMPAIFFTAMLVAFAFILPRRFSPVWICVAITTGLACGMWQFSGTSYWFKYAFTVGANHYPMMHLGQPSNLPALMTRAYGWDLGGIEDAVMTLPSFETPRWLLPVLPSEIGGDISLRTLLLTIFFTLSVFCAVMAAMNWRRRDPRVIVALTLPWILFFTIPAQVHERYLLYGSACCAIFLACSRGWFLLGLVFTFIALLPTVDTTLRFNYITPGGFDAKPFEIERLAATFINGTFPGIAWGLMMAIVIALYGLLPAATCTGSSARRASRRAPQGASAQIPSANLSIYRLPTIEPPTTHAKV